MWWPSGKGQDMHIDVMAKPLYEIPLETRKGTPLEFLEDEEQVINVVPYTDYASILYLNDNFEGGETYFEDGQVFASPLFRLFTPLLARIGCTTPLRLRANLLINRNKHIRGIEHTDEITERMDHNTAIFYLNTCNGKTVVDGTEVESIANRVVIFPANTPHYVISQTDTDRRIVLNINYYPC